MSRIEVFVNPVGDGVTAPYIIITDIKTCLYAGMTLVTALPTSSPSVPDCLAGNVVAVIKFCRINRSIIGQCGTGFAGDEDRRRDLNTFNGNSCVHAAATPILIISPNVSGLVGSPTMQSSMTSCWV